MKSKNDNNKQVFYVMLPNLHSKTKMRIAVRGASLNKQFNERIVFDPPSPHGCRCFSTCFSPKKRSLSSVSCIIAVAEVKARRLQVRKEKDL